MEKTKLLEKLKQFLRHILMSIIMAHPSDSMKEMIAILNKGYQKGEK